jgi:hypothetical protein
MARRKTYRNLYVGLTQKDQARLEALAKIDGKTKTELAREAMTWYLDHRENEQNADRDSVYAKALKEMTNRICGMRARQGAEVGVLYEVTWRNFEANNDAESFISAANYVKSKMRKRLDADEKALAAKMGNIVKS